MCALLDAIPPLRLLMRRAGETTPKMNQMPNGAPPKRARPKIRGGASKCWVSACPRDGTARADHCKCERSIASAPLATKEWRRSHTDKCRTRNRLEDEDLAAARTPSRKAARYVAKPLSKESETGAAGRREAEPRAALGQQARTAG